MREGGREGGDGRVVTIAQLSIVLPCQTGGQQRNWQLASLSYSSSMPSSSEGAALPFLTISLSLRPIAGLQIYSPSYDSATSQLDFRQYEGLLRSPDLEPDAFRHEAVSARRIYEFKSYRDGQVSVERLRDLASRNLGT